MYGTLAVDGAEPRRDSKRMSLTLDVQARAQTQAQAQAQELSAGFDFVMVFPMDGEPGSYTQSKHAKF